MRTLAQSALLAKVSRRLCREGWPRLHMTLIMAVSGLGAFLASFSLLRLGVVKMWVRYPLAVTAGYLLFFVLLKVWLVYQKRSAARDLLDVLDCSPTDFPCPGVSTHPIDAEPWTEWLPGLDWDELAAVLVIIAALLLALVAAAVVIYSAPALMAEALVDAAVIAGLQKRMMSHPASHWTVGVLRRTLIPMLLVALTFSVAGFAMEVVRPGTKSVGDLWKNKGTNSVLIERQDAR